MKSRRPRKWPAGLLIALGTAVTGVTLLQLKSAAQWVEGCNAVPGTVLDAELIETQQPRPMGRTSTSLRAMCFYYYTVAGREFEASTIEGHPFRWVAPNRWQQHLSTRYSIGQVIPVFVHPDDPAQACLLPLPNPWLVAGLLTLSTTLTALGLWVLVIQHRYRSTFAPRTRSWWWIACGGFGLTLLLWGGPGSSPNFLNPQSIGGAVVMISPVILGRFVRLARRLSLQDNRL